MATATQDFLPAEPSVLDVGLAERPVSEDLARRGEYRCECGNVLRVFGGGRHRVYFEPDQTALDDPVMDRVCPQCGSGLPGKNSRS